MTTNRPVSNSSARHALQFAFRSISSVLEVGGGRVEKNRRFSQVICPFDDNMDKCFSCDFWDRGVYLAWASTADPLELARSIHAWVEEMATTSQMKQLFPFVHVEAIAEAFEDDKEVAWKWTAVEELAREDKRELVPLVIAAQQRIELKQLFPYTSITSLCLSRCTGFPFSSDCPYAIPKKEGQYEVFDASGKSVGTGDAESAVLIIINHLPPNCGPATKGTADDLQTSTALPRKDIPSIP